MDSTELRVVLGGFGSDLEEVDEPLTIRYAREMEDAELYAVAVVSMVERRGALWAACDDIASSLGEVEYEVMSVVVDAVARQWDHLADALDVWDPTALRVRAAAAQLRSEAARDELDVEMVQDLVTVPALDNELRDHAAALAIADESGAGDEYLADHAARVEWAFRTIAGVKANLRQRGELSLDDELLPEPDE